MPARKEHSDEKKKRKAEYDRQRYLANKEEHRLRCKQYYTEHCDEVKQKTAAYQKANRDKANEYNRGYYARNKTRLRHTAYAHKVAKLRATPPWLSVNDRKKIADFYAARPEGHHVDHIVPLRGENICGLHVPWNLQYLPASENLSKGNKYDPV